MLRNYIKIAFRILWRGKSFSTINIAGLSIGMASAVLILLWIQNELSYDQFHRNKKYLYEVWNREVFDGKLQCWNATPKILGPTLKQEFPQITEFTRVSFPRWFVTTVGEKKVSSKSLVTDPSFLSMFSFPLIKGNTKTALDNVYSIVVTEKMAKKMFGTEDVMNEIIKIDRDNFTITGILKDLPTNSSFDFEYLLPWAYLTKLGQDDNYWGNNSIDTYVQIQPGVTEEAADNEIKNTTRKHSNGSEETEVFLHPLSKWHLFSEFENGKISGGRIEMVRLFGIIATCILLIACINFMNLSTARSEKRAKEVGIRKVAGANKQALIGQFLGESILITTISAIFALLLVQGFLLPFDNLVNKELVIPYNSVYFWVAAIGFILITGIVAGSYPAFFMSSFKPVSILKGTFKRIHAGINLRKVLVISQFGFAIVLIVSTWIVMQQIRYVQERETGFVRDQLVYHWITGELSKSYPLIKNELVRSGSVKFLAKTSAPLIDNFNDTWSIQWEGKDPNAKIDFDRFNEDEGLVKTAGLQLVQGRDMDLVNFPSDSSAALLNESAVHAMGFTQPIGQLIKDERFEYHVVGVIRDFVMGSPNENTRPEIILGAKGNDVFNVINMRLNQNRPAAENLQSIEKIFKKYSPDYPFELHFVDLDYAKKFEDMQKTAVFSGLFTGLTILISCLGLFGLSAFMAESRIKEIGVRKVLGASVSGIVRLLSKDFLTLILISILIACPIAWFVMHHWLQAYSYRIQIDWWVFLLSGLTAILIAGITVSFQAIRAALGNPVKAIRSE